MKKIVKNILKWLRQFVNCLKQSPNSSTNQRREKLKEFAIIQFQNPNRLEVLVAIVDFAVTSVKGVSNPSKEVIADLKAVLIGGNMTICRGVGASFAGNVKGASGFKKELQDPWNQIQHAIAGIVIAYQYGNLGSYLVKLLEGEPQDVKLYDVTFPIGENLNNENYLDLPKKLKEAIGEN